MTTHRTNPGPTRRRYRWRPLALLLLAVVLAALGLHWWRAHLYRQRIQALEQRWSAAGLPLELSQVTSSATPEETLIAHLYLEIMGTRHPDAFPDLPSFAELGRYGRLPDWCTCAVDDYLRAPGEDTAFAFRQALRQPALQRIYDDLESAAAHPTVRFPVDYAAHDLHLTHLDGLREVVDLFCARASLATADGDADEAASWISRALQVSEHVAQQPTLRAQLTARACLARSVEQIHYLLAADLDLPAASTRALVDQLGALRWERYQERARLFEYCRTLQLLRGYAADPATLPGLDYDSGRPGWSWGERPWPALRGLRRSAGSRELLALYLEDVLQLEGARSLPPPQRYQRLRRLHRELVDEHQWASPLRAVDMFPADQAADYASVLALRDLALLALALDLDYHRAGEYPPTLSSLQSALPGPLPQDTFAGGPYHYRRLPEGFLLYSVGPDLRDDGGVAYRGPRSGDLRWPDSLTSVDLPPGPLPVLALPSDPPRAWQQIDALLERGDVAAVHQLVRQYPELVDRPVALERTALHSAALHGYPELVRLLVEQGADLEAAPHLGSTPLQAACRAQVPGTVAVLLELGADPHVRGVHGRTLLHTAVEGAAPHAPREEQLRLLRLLLEAGIDPRLRDDEGRTPLFYAERTDVVELLLSSGADPDSRDQYGDTPLHYMIRESDWWCRLAVVDLLLRRGPDRLRPGADGLTVDQLLARHLPGYSPPPASSWPLP